MVDTSDSVQLDPTAEVARAVRALLPELRKRAVVTLLVIVSVLVLSLAAAYALLHAQLEDDDGLKMAMIALFAGAGVIVFAYRSMVSRQEALVMPILAETVGMTFSKNAKAFVGGLPKRLLPARGIRTGEDLIKGQIGAHTIQMAEVEVETGGKNSRTLFKGVVAQFTNRTPMPAFFLAREDKTRPGAIFSGELSTDGLFLLHSVQGGGERRYGVWTSSPDAKDTPVLSAVVKIFTEVENHLGPGTTLYAVTSNGEETHIALNHKRNLFRVGGLFPNEAKLFLDVTQALQDLLVPLNLAKQLIAAEETTVANVTQA